MVEKFQMPALSLKNIMPWLLIRLESLIRPVRLTEKEGLPYWREQILNTLLLVGIIIGLFAVATGVPYCIREGLWALAAIDVAAYLLVIGLFIFKQLSYSLRAWCAVLAFYVIGGFMLFNLGIFSSALIWLFVFPAAAGIFIGLGASVFAIALNILTFIGYDVLLALDVMALQFSQGINSLQRILVIETDFILLAILLNASTIYLVKKLRVSLAAETTTREELEMEVAERKHLEAALRESETKYRTYFESVSDVIYTLDSNLRVTGLSPSASRMSGYSEQEIIGKPFPELNVLDPAYLEKALEDYNKVLNGDHAESVYEFILKDGTRRFGQVRGAPLTRNGEIVGIIAVGRDITELKEAWNALEHSRERFRETVELLPSAVFEIDLNMELTYSNSPGLTFLGLTQKDLEAGLNALTYVHPDDQPQIQNALEKLKNTGTVSPAAIRVITRHGEELTALINVAPIYEGGEFSGVRTCLTDITAQRKMEEALFKAKQLESLGTLAGGIAHDFNNLLAVILGNISMLKMAPELDAGNEAWLQEAETASLKAKELTARLLTFTRAGDPSGEYCDIETVLRDAAKSSIRKAQAIDCIFSLPPDAWSAHIDPDQCRILFSNILSNAMEALAGSGEIRITAENFMIDSQTNPQLQPGRYLRVKITDNGPGIPDDIIRRIFDPYFSTKVKGTQKGMGLGLTIAQSIAHKHGGTITVVSEPGSGTTANIFLPACDEKPEKAEKGAPPSPALDQKEEKRILVMDDEEMIRQLMASMMDRLGYAYEMAVEGGEAVELYRNAKAAGKPFDALILDLSNKIGLDGKTAMQQILEINPEAIGIVASGYAQDPVISEPREYGFCRAIAKPYSIKNLKKILDEIFL